MAVTRARPRRGARVAAARCAAHLRSSRLREATDAQWRRWFSFRASEAYMVNSADHAGSASGLWAGSGGGAVGVLGMGVSPQYSVTYSVIRSGRWPDQ